MSIGMRKQGDDVQFIVYMGIISAAVIAIYSRAHYRQIGPSFDSNPLPWLPNIDYRNMDRDCKITSTCLINIGSSVQNRKRRPLTLKVIRLRPVVCLKSTFNYVQYHIEF